MEIPVLKKAIFVAGSALLLFAIFAVQLGVDNDGGWGTGRLAILVAGLVINLVGIASIRYPEQFARSIKFLSSQKHVLIAFFIVAVMYVWLGQINLRNTRQNYQYYSELAKSFRHGQIHLAEEPSAALLALSNPYDYDLRLEAQVEDFPWDVSLYKQKFYVYWGPAPSLLLAIFSDQPGDHPAVVGRNHRRAIGAAHDEVRIEDVGE